jgi:hypothetical protein
VEDQGGRRYSKPTRARRLTQPLDDEIDIENEIAMPFLLFRVADIEFQAVD